MAMFIYQHRKSHHGDESTSCKIDRLGHLDLHNDFGSVERNLNPNVLTRV